MKKAVCQIILQIFCITQLIGQEPNWLLFDVSNSPLKDNRISSVETDYNGNVWIGTIYSGIYKFDGESWTNYTTANSGLHTNYPIEVHSDINNNIWVSSGWSDGRIAQFNGEKWFVHNSLNSNGVIFEPAPINCISSGSNGDVYFAIWNGLLKYDGTNWSRISGLPLFTSYNFVEIDNRQNMWLVSGFGDVLYFNGDTVIIYNQTNSNLASSEIKSLEIESNGTPWVTTDNSGVAFFDGENWNVLDYDNSSIPHERINGMTIDNQNIKWFSTGPMWDKGIGIIKYDNNTWTLYNKENSDLPSYKTWNLDIDKNNNLWIGTDDKGVAVFNSKGITLSTSVVSSVYPNPVKNNLQFQFKKGYLGSVSITVINQFGQIVYDDIVSNHLGFFQLNTTKFSSGVYFIIITYMDGVRETKKIIKI